MTRIIRLDRQFVWHPFTQMKDWLKAEPIVIVRGRGAVLQDQQGRTFLDGNSSIWTNLHGHGHPRINAALRRQLGRIAHCSSLGLVNEPAAELAAQLVSMANPPSLRRQPSRTAPHPLEKVFFSDDGSTAIEAALKLSYEFTRRTRGIKQPRFLSLQGGYHGDTLGAVSVGHIDLFHQNWGGLLFKSGKVMAPYCYRCPFNRAQPDRADARSYRSCKWECIDAVQAPLEKARKQNRPITAMVIEPLIQGAAGMIPQPAGWLSRVDAIARSHQVQLITDEVLTGLGRASGRSSEKPGTPAFSHPLLASHQEQVQPTFAALAKGLTGGYLPMAATLTTREVFDAFLGEYAEFKTFFHGHSYSGNPLAAAAAIESLALLQAKTTPTPTPRERLQSALAAALPALWATPHFGDIRQVGGILAVELVRDWTTREPFPLAQQAGIRVCAAMARRGVLTRPIGNVVVLMPPYCTTSRQVTRMLEALVDATEEVFASPRVHSHAASQSEPPRKHRPSGKPKPRPPHA